MAEVTQLQAEIAQLKLLNQQRRTSEQSILPHIPLPEPLTIKSGDTSENIKQFRSRWELYLQGTGISNCDAETNKAILLPAIGCDVFRRYRNMPIGDGENKTASDLLNAIERNLSATHHKQEVCQGSI